jgi:hypothetical protein
MKEEEYIEVLGEYFFSRTRVTKHGYEAKSRLGWEPIPEWLYDECFYAGVMRD